MCIRHGYATAIVAETSRVCPVNREFDGRMMEYGLVMDWRWQMLTAASVVAEEI